MDYQEAIEYMDNLNKSGTKLGLYSITQLLKRLGNPHKDKKVIHVAGTNGKGSTCAMIASVLKEQGYKIGFYTSPFLQLINESIQINQVNITNEDFAKIITEVKETADKMFTEGLDYPTEFEILTAAAFYYFDFLQVDFIILEVGLGGRLDATNVIEKPLISVITKISMDHMQFLGSTLKAIASEKCGIIKKNCPVVTSCQVEEVYNVIEQTCKKENSYLSKAETIMLDSDSTEINLDNLFKNIQYTKNNDIINLRLKLLGEYQTENLKTALKVLEELQKLGFDINNYNIVSGIENAKWPGRFEIVKENPILILDGAHNEDGMKAFLKSVNKYFRNKKKTLVIGILKDKDYKTMISDAAKIFDKIILTESVSPRRASADKLASVAALFNKNVTCISEYKKATDFAMENIKEEEILCFAGSLYLIGPIRTYLYEKYL